MGQTINSLQFLRKSRLLISLLNGGKGTELFEQTPREVLLSLVKLIFSGQAELVGMETSCLTHMVEAVPDSLSEILKKMVISFPLGQVIYHKLETLQAIVRCPLFQVAGV